LSIILRLIKSLQRLLEK